MTVNEEPQDIPKWKDLKDIFLAKKQGEALERITKPQEHYEGLGLGYYGPQTVLALAAVDLFEDICNNLADMKDSNELHVFTEEIGVASGSRSAKRMEKSLETIGQLGQYRPGPPKWQPFGEQEKEIADE